MENKKIKYWLHADADDKKEPDKSEPEKKKEPTFNEDEFLKKIMEAVDKKLEGIKINPQEPEKKKEPEKEYKEIQNRDPRVDDIIENLKAQNQLFLMNKKDELKSKYNLSDEDVAEINTLEDLNKYEKIYAKSFEKAKETYLSEETIAKELAKRKKMIADMDNKPGEEVMKKQHDNMTKEIFKLINKK